MNEDFEIKKKEFKETIEELINSNRLNDAKYMLGAYEDIVKHDMDIFSIKAVIAMMEGNGDEADHYLNSGLIIDSNHFDLLYNKAFLKEQQGEMLASEYYYKLAYSQTDNHDIQKMIDQKISGCGKRTENREEGAPTSIIIGSPIHQKPQILKEFLTSLEDLNKQGCDIHFIFIDDNDNEESSRLLAEFAEKQDALIVKSGYMDEYVCNDVNHSWNKKNIWKVANFKNFIIHKTIEMNCDYLFLIDSDLVLNPNTLMQLLSDEKDIVSNVFWTKWSPNDKLAMPQVWLKDQYTLFEQEENEHLEEHVKVMRTLEFINKLKVPSVYEVGGLGACTLIRCEALLKGVNFSKVKNVSFIGEDRHFCIRAEVLGLKLHVDTHFPAYHIYREADLQGVAKFRQENSQTKPVKKKIALVYTGYSGSNTLALYKSIPQEISEKYEVRLLRQSAEAAYFDKLMECDVVVLTEGNYHVDKSKFNPNQIVLDLWHGFPLKAMGYEDKNEVYKDKIAEQWKYINYISSYSELFNDVMNKCIRQDADKYFVTGAPRNDFLFSSDGKQNLEQVLGKNLQNKKVFFFMPTYRYASRGNRYDGFKSWSNIFGFSEFNQSKFKKFLKENNIVLVAKLHPAEEAYFIEHIDKSENIVLLTGEMLEKNNFDLYELLNACDVMITDYSSVYFDFLLLDKPMIFTPIDLKEYENNRGFLLEPYDDWAPGPKATDQKSLMDDMLVSIDEQDSYGEQRKKVRKQVYEFEDGNSCKRVWDFIENIQDR